jgi:hypothetical protein
MSTETMLPAKITTARYDRRKLFRLVLFVLGGMSAAAPFAIPSRADGNRTLIIPANDGYGFDECLKAGSQCGIIVADAWCKAHGFGASKSFGPETASTADPAPNAYRVTCGESVN